MRISDWSSDVCSSDLPAIVAPAAVTALRCKHGVTIAARCGTARRARCGDYLFAHQPGRGFRFGEIDPLPVAAVLPMPERGHDRAGPRHAVGDIHFARSAERRVGKEGGSTCSYRWSP